MNKLIVDVRTKEEFEEEHIDGAINIPLMDISEGNIDALKNIPKETELGVYCRSGARSEIAKEILQNKGFIHTTNLGGINNLL